MVRLFDWSIPDRNDLIADKLVDGSVPLEDESAHLLEVLLHHREHILGAHGFRHRGEAADVDEQQRQVAPLAVRDDLVDRFRRRELSGDPGIDVMAEDQLHLAPLALLEHVAGSQRERCRQCDGDWSIEGIAQVAVLSKHDGDGEVSEQDHRGQEHPAAKRQHVDDQAHEKLRSCGKLTACE